MEANRQDGDELLAVARAGADGFAQFYRHFERSMLGFFMRETGRPDLAADLAAETFARALESVAAFDPAIAETFFGALRGRDKQFKTLAHDFLDRRFDFR